MCSNSRSLLRGVFTPSLTGAITLLLTAAVLQGLLRNEHTASEQSDAEEKAAMGEGVTETLQLSGLMISEYTQIVLILPQTKSHQKMRSLLLENLAFLYSGCVTCRFFSKTERNIFP